MFLNKLSFAVATYTFLRTPHCCHLSPLPQILLQLWPPRVHLPPPTPPPTRKNKCLWSSHAFRSQVLSQRHLFNSIRYLGLHRNHSKVH
ncbi:hypothetical protein NL676_025608 [Syzygium grande]|nr:hypothetical protein NL676_025608 [Syzygium grande]